MSTVSITAYEVSTPAVRVAAPATRLRLTRRGRRVLAALAAAPVAVGLALAVMSGGGALASREDGAPAGTFDTVTVMPGDSLWSIAETVAPDTDPRDVVDAIVALNQLSSTSVLSGETISIPAEFSTAG
ncbi:LysM peptidoglycan-binding domain-containing protein [Microbacterium stercoris]|uniref:LysM peptidoglycan-binding domain-containing protein n=1 Tax=Microbacterium stercoris TaxID=2820289 RepID=A0A939QQV0_9MICO|nr:LysM peptidoglycan-binding domain-containing protein [Microbacterium stercoris]MBO3663368.1 LysM peptidoglycan-binding domain-containing protein [Microbacterium stercoris]